MTDTELDQVEATSGRGQGQGQGKRRWVLVIGALIVLTAVGAWFLAQPLLGTKMAVTWSGPLECSGSRVTQERADDETVETMLLRPAMRCHRSFTVKNNGSLPVTITSVRLDFMAPTNAGPPVQVTEFDGLSPLREDGDGFRAIDAVFPTRHKLPAGHSRTFTIDFVHRQDACMSDGLLWVNKFPDVEIQAPTGSAHISPQGAIGFRTDVATKAKHDCSN